MTTTISIDTGGTFTDGYFTRDGVAHSIKVFTTPHDVTVGMLECVEAGAAALGLDVGEMLTETEVFRFSSTIVTNALLEGRGSVVGLITTGDQASTPEVVTRGLVRPDLVIDLADVNDPDSVEGAIETLLDRGAQVLAVSFEGSWTDPAGERGVRQRLRTLYPAHYLGSVRVFLASDVTPLPGHTARTNTVVLNALVHELLWRTTYGAEDRLRSQGLQHPFLLVQSHGGVARTAKTLALQTFNSGPVAGALGCLDAEKAVSGGRFVAFDVGGTSTDVAVVSHESLTPTWTTEFRDLALHVPVIPVSSFAIGGGTVAWLDGSELRLGPRSAGSQPGPACFNRGGLEATVTDANLYLGLLAADGFHGGRFELRRDLAESALDRLGVALGCSAEDVAHRIRNLANETMAAGVASTMKQHSLESEGSALVAYGGGGGLHAAAVAARMGMRLALVPWLAPVFSAVGVSAMDIKHAYPVLVQPGLDEQTLVDLLASAQRDLAAEGRSWEDAVLRLDVLEVERIGRSLWRESWMAPPSLEDCQKAWAEVLVAASGVQTALVVLSVETPLYTAPATTATKDEGDRQHRSEMADWGAGPRTTTRVDLVSEPADDFALAGPALLFSGDMTVAVPPGWTVQKSGPWLRLEETA